MAFEQYIPSRRFVEHLAGAERQRARVRCSSAGQHARGAAGLEGGRRKRTRGGDRPGKRRNGRRVARSVAAARLEGGGRCERARERARVQRAGAGAANKRRTVAFRPARWTTYAARAVFARPLEQLFRLRALKGGILRRGASLARLLEML